MLNTNENAQRERIQTTDIVEKRKERRNLSSQTLSTQLQQIAAQAAADPNFVFHNIVHHIDETLLWEAFQRLRKEKEKATGIDGETDEPCIDGEIKEN